jgi:metal-responsive CopG/Arc/MetJ family transcriptional regulator
MNPKVGKTRFSISMPTDLVIKLDMLRDSEKRNRTDFIQIAVKEKVERMLSEEIIDIREIKQDVEDIKRKIEHLIKK